MTSPGFARLFSSPLMAVVIGAIIVAGCACLAYRTARGKPAPAAVRYWTRLSLVAEICVAVGLIGLASFAGAMKIGTDHQLLEERVRLAQAAVGERLRLAALENCSPVEGRPMAPFNPSVARKDLCAIAQPFVDANLPDAAWQAAEGSLREFTAKYPGCIENVFTRHSDCDGTVASATGLADEIRVLEMHKRAYRNDEAMSAMLEAPSSWVFLLLAFLVAAIGVSIKCARAASEYVTAVEEPGR